MEKIEEDDCVLCCRKTTIYAVGVCDHPVCYECSARMRVLCKQNECPICRQDLPKVVFSQKLQLFSMLNRVTYPLDKKYKIYFEDDICRRMYDKLLEHTCKFCPNKPYFHTFVHMKHHMQRTHEHFYCDLCVTNLRIFTSERKCYTREELARHRRVGDSDDTSHRGHPLCKFCDQRYVDQDELFRHLRREHFFCHFCDADGDINKFYSDYEYLRAHFRQEHYLCEEGSCQHEKFTPVFRSEIDLKAHRALQHSKNLSKAQAKQARTLELGFTIKPRSSQHNESVSLTTENFQRPENHYGSGSISGNKERNSVRSNTSYTSSRNGCLIHVPTSSLDTQSEEEFPCLKSSMSPAHGTTNLPNKTIATAVTKDMKNSTTYQSKLSTGNDNFPALSPNNDFPELQYKMPPQHLQNHSSQRTVLFHFNSQTNRNNSTNLSIQLGNHKDVNLLVGASNLNSGHSNSNMVTLRKKNGSKFENNRHQSSVDNATTVSSLPEKVTASKKTFEEDFPQLHNDDKHSSSTKCLIMPTTESKSRFQSIVNSSEKYQPLITVKCKSKKKKQKSFMGMEVRPKEMPPVDPCIKKSETSALTLAQLVNSNIFENQENENMLSDDKDRNGNDDIAEELDEQTETLLVHDDFSDINKKVSTPPGFNSTRLLSSLILPPGFASSTPESENPAIPSTDSLSTIAKQLEINSHTEIQDVEITDVIQAQSSNYVYVEPLDFQHRNVILIQRIHKLLDGNDTLFTEFKSLSGHFRQSSITAEHYYKECLEIFGIEGFLQVVPELLVLLPDINKQQDLLSIVKTFFRTKLENSGAVPKGTFRKDTLQFEVCKVCKQVLSKNDFEYHQKNAHLMKVQPDK